MTLLTYISQFLSFIIPVRIGEFTKGIYLSNQSKYPLSKSILWVFVDRLVDFWIVLTILGVLLLTVQTAVPTNISQTIGGLVVILSAGIAITIYYPNLVKKISGVVLFVVFIKRLKHLLLAFIKHIIDSFSILKVSFKKQLLVVGLTTVSWIFEAIAWVIVLAGLGVSVPTSFALILLGTMLMALSFILPAAPGYLGSLQAAGLLVFAFWLGFDSNTISAATVLMHLGIIIYILIAGIGSLYFLKLDLKEVFSKFRK